MKYFLLIFLTSGVFIGTNNNLSNFFMLKKEPISIILTGDIMLGRYVETLMGQLGKEYPFKEIALTTKSGDVVIGNLEGPIPDVHTHTKNGAMLFSFPLYTVDVLQSAGFTHVSLANNHAFDSKYAGYINTVTQLDSGLINALGRPDNKDCFEIIDVKEKKIGIVSFNDTWGGVADAQIGDCIDSIQNTDYKIVYIHWGDEYVVRNERQRILAEKFIDLGIDIVVGHHPHVIQDVEWYNGKPIFYSLGNLIFDQYFSSSVQDGIILEILLNDEITYILHHIKSTKSQPKVVKTTVITQ